MFKIWARKAVSKELIKKAWSVHFPYFSYEKYSTKIEMIYNEAVKNEIPRKDLEQYVLEHLLNLKWRPAAIVLPSPRMIPSSGRALGYLISSL